MSQVDLPGRFDQRISKASPTKSIVVDYPENFWLYNMQNEAKTVNIFNGPGEVIPPTHRDNQGGRELVGAASQDCRPRPAPDL
jgi:hypothetical protein